MSVSVSRRGAEVVVELPKGNRLLLTPAEAQKLAAELVRASLEREVSHGIRVGTKAYDLLKEMFAKP